MPITTVYGDGVRVVGSTSQPLLPQPLHPNVMDYVGIMQSPTGGNYAMSLTEIDAVNNLVWGLVGMGIWTKIKAIYPIIGTTAAAHKWNLKDPRDADAAYRLSFLGGGWTHSSNGATPNGTTSYANTFLNSNTVLSLTSNHLSYYSRTASTIAIVYDCGTSTNASGATNNFSLILKRSTGSISGFDSGNGNTSRASTTGIANSSGFFIGSKISNSDRRLFYNGIIRATSIVSDTNTLASVNVYLGAINNNGSASFFGNRQCAFFSIGDGLNNVEARAFGIIVQAFQTALGRQV